jgi:hypothetical protein
VKATFEDTSTREYDLGARYTFMPDSKWRPFVGAALGATHLAAARADFPNLDGSGTTRVTLGESDTVFSQRAGDRAAVRALRRLRPAPQRGGQPRRRRHPLE